MKSELFKLLFICFIMGIHKDRLQTDNCDTEALEHRLNPPSPGLVTSLNPDHGGPGARLGCHFHSPVNNPARLSGSVGTFSSGVQRPASHDASASLVAALGSY